MFPLVTPKKNPLPLVRLIPPEIFRLAFFTIKITFLDPSDAGDEIVKLIPPFAAPS
ncbi:MAG: hypothetical protein UU74_C0044G0010 [Candidatus Woesebacteria bacterium GW2011_GWA1_41_7]|uniref:Uncharacterized protein n=1 Tax=Candidatus Woesebacteria bacterium GW2011_GWA1_41_7 TaxID=1618556 RepID=A0A0G0WUA2_9BACT|nr:MAG: hypothetical protein UU74_C0044G0010 [Candidatus Woesebacteria bacterium GW2011_GWA1_41_7]